MNILADNHKRRYARHLTLEAIGEAGQAKLAASSVLIIGAGGLGAASIAYLAAMGVGTIGVVDADRVELSNLQRQILYETGDIGRLKVEAAADRVHEVNPEITLKTYADNLTTDNAETLIAPYDVVLDGCDNFPTRFAVQAACLALKKPLISAAISGFSGQLSVFTPYEAGQPCYRCLVPEIPPHSATCAQEGMLGAVAGVMGSLQAVEAVKCLVSIGKPLTGQLLRYDALAAHFTTVLIRRDETCPLCTHTV